MNRPAGQYVPPNTQIQDRELWNRLNFLLTEVDNLKAEMKKVSGSGSRLDGLQTQIQAAADSLTELQTYVGKGQTQFVSTSSSLSATGVGMTISGSIGSGTISITNAASFRSAISAAAKANPAIAPATIPLAKITGGGTDGSITVNAEGIITSYVAPT